MSSENIDFGDFIEFSIKKKFGIIRLNRVHRGNAITTEMVKNLKNPLLLEWILMKLMVGIMLL